MVRDLVKTSLTSIVLRSVETYIDVLEYCLSDISLHESSNIREVDAFVEQSSESFNEITSTPIGTSVASASNSHTQGSQRISTQNPGNAGDALEMMTSFGKALLDLGRVVVEDISRTGGPLGQTSGGNRSRDRDVDNNFRSIAIEIKGLLCPTAASNFAKLGVNGLWVGTLEQQRLMRSLEAKFVHSKCFERPILSNIFSNQTLQRYVKLQSFSPYLLAKHMRVLFSEHWVNHVMGANKAPWFSWENTLGSSGHDGPSPEWIKLFWKNFSGSSDELSLFYDWPLIPAFLGRPVLCRVKEHNLVFIPPSPTSLTPGNDISDSSAEGNELEGSSSTTSTESDLVQSYTSAFKAVESTNPWLLSLLNQCNIPIFDLSFLECACPSTCLPTPGQSLGQVIVSKLLAVKHAGYFSEPAFPVGEHRDELFNLFASDLISYGFTYSREERDILRSLPMYKTAVGTYTHLHGQGQCIISPNSFFQPLDEHCLSYSTVSGGNMLFNALGVSELHEKKVLVRFALPGFEGKSQDVQEDILFYIYTNWQDLQLDSDVVGALEETKFIRCSNEFCVERFKPNELLDPSDALLTSVFSEERNRFPGETFRTDGWLRILRKTGLRTATEADVILECAKKVEYLGGECMKGLEDPDDFMAHFSSSQNEVSPEIWSLAISVVDSIFSNFAIFYGNNFCNQLSKIAFVPSEKGIPSIVGKRRGKRVLCSYNEATLLKDWQLAWSVAPILTSQSVVPPEYSWGALHLRSPPPFSTVLKHLQVVGRDGGEDILAHWPMSSGMTTMEGASCEILKYLDKMWGTLSTSDITELQRVEFMSVANGTRLVTANSLFVRLSVNLSPFAFELPTPYLPFLKVLKDLGLQDVLSFTCAMDLLLRLQRSCGYQRLNPNELRAVMEILHFVCDSSVQADRAGGSEWVSEAVVPDDGCRLVLARSCVYIDSYGSHFIRFIDFTRLRFVHSVVPESLCTTLGIKKLSDIVVEELDQKQQLQPLDQIGAVQLATIKEKISSRAFQAAVWTVVNNIANLMPALGNLSLEQIQSSLEYVAQNMQFVQSLRTRFILLPKSVDITRVTNEPFIPDWSNGSGHRTLLFIDKSKACALVAEPPHYISVYDVIAIAVSQVLGSPIPLPIGSLLSSPVGLEKAIISPMKLGYDRKENEPGGGRYQLVGKELLPQDAPQVQFHPLRPFYRGEIVAWKTGKDGDKLKYGRVPENVRPSAGQALYRFKVETAPGETQPLLSSQIFSFRSVSTGREVSSSLVEGNVDVEETKLVQVLKNSGSNEHISQVQPAKEAQFGRVSAGELVQAVHDMLHAAGVNMDGEKQSLLQTALTLQEQLKDSQAALLLEQEKSDSAVKEADMAKAAWLCRICLSQEVDTTIVPCGHVLCRRCSSAVSRCPFCRLQVSKTIKIFRP